ncbi:hypothetical protein CMV_014975 [Castanea mollissima]|uniref:Uncharacterized protein n=1 Tax=Castanea mollissima TaxID=60419 RepID=A0A8J4RAV4_9ROSI|nr:hypothetical protein CMV_014975 [Castanea mollissima]
MYLSIILLFKSCSSLVCQMYVEVLWINFIQNHTLHEKNILGNMEKNPQSLKLITVMKNLHKLGYVLKIFALDDGKARSMWEQLGGWISILGPEQYGHIDWLMDIKMEKGTGQFCWSAGQCGAMPLGCPLPAQGMQPPMGMLPRSGRAAAKAKAAPMGRQPRPGRAAAMGTQQPRPWHACVGTLATPMACSSQGQGAWHAAEAKASPMGVLPRPRQGMQPRPRQPPWACCCQGQGSPHGRAAKAKAWVRSSQGQGTQPRPWHALQQYT